MRKILLSLFVLSLSLSATAQMAQPGPEHAAMKQLAGNWKGSATLQLPGMEPASSEVSASYELQLGGFWLIGNYEGRMMGVPFSGRSLFGYDSGKKKYVEVWIDSMRSNLSQLEGDYDAKTRTWTKWLDGKHPMTGAPIKERHTVQLIDDDHFRMELAMPDEDGEYMPYMVVEQARVQ